MRKRILVIDDERTLCLSMQEGLKDMGYIVLTALNGEEGINQVVVFQPNMVFLDLRLPDIGGLDVLKEIKNIDKDIEVIIMTAYADTKTAVSAIKIGALDYLTKPFELEKVKILVEKTFENKSLKDQTHLLRENRQKSIPPIIGKDSSMLDVMKKVKILAQNNDATVLIRGETGTGKELIASYIHYNSRRKDKPFVDINCGTIPEKLLESELFGFERNAFTGAREGKKGLFEMANEGSVFLDEIGELSMDMQVKLLRFLEERRFRRIAGLRDIEVDVRIITATNVNLEKAIEQKTFREDLYYRLNVVPVMLPPLRDRGKDIISLAEYFLEQYNKKMGRYMTEISEEVKEIFVNYQWPGNIRELKNVIERIAILYNDERLEIRHLPPEMLEGYIRNDMEEEMRLNGMKDNFEAGFSLESFLEDIEKKYIRWALDKTNWNSTEAARILGISRYTIHRRIEKYFKNNG